MYVPPGSIAQLKWSKKVRNVINTQGHKNILSVCLLRNVQMYRFACFALVFSPQLYATAKPYFEISVFCNCSV